MDFNWNKNSFVTLALCLFAASITVATSSCAENGEVPTEIGLISVGISNGRPPSFLLFWKDRPSVMATKWFKDNKSDNPLVVKLSLVELNNICKLLQNQSQHKDTNGLPAGTYTASRWNNTIRLDYIMEPKKAKDILMTISKCEIPKEQRTVIDQVVNSAIYTPLVGGH